MRFSDHPKQNLDAYFANMKKLYGLQLLLLHQPCYETAYFMSNIAFNINGDKCFHSQILPPTMIYLS